MDIKKTKYIIVTVVTFIVIIFLFRLIGYVESEGFNPTDEGVVLAQSWRIVNGQIPHKDFISIRPALSGYLHSINLYIPGALVPNSRWFVVIQFYIIAVVLSSFVCSEIERNTSVPIKGVNYFSFLIVSFVITVFNFIVYPWTTIDAVFWSVLSIPFIFNKSFWKISLGLFFLACATLSRQTFALLYVMANIFFLIQYRNKLKKLVAVIIFGALPFIFYFAVLISNNAIGDFIAQMTGRSEFFETAIIQYVKKAVFSLSTPLNILLLILSGYVLIKNKLSIKEKLVSKGVTDVVVIVYLIFLIGIIVRHFLLKVLDIWQLPFSLFFSTTAVSIFYFVMFPNKKRVVLISLFIIVIAWISSISLGANAPVFASGPLFIVLMYLLIDILASTNKKVSVIKFISNRYLILIISLGLFALGINSQQSVNYRDLSKSNQISGINQASDEFGKIITNKYVKSYYCELVELFKNLPNSQNHTVVFPHNAIFYPLMKTNNPAPLDWLISNEYVGVEKRVEDDFFKLISSKNLYFIVEQVDVRIISDGFFPREYGRYDIIYNLIENNCQELFVETEYFKVYKTSP